MLLREGREFKQFVVDINYTKNCVCGCIYTWRFVSRCWSQGIWA